MPSSSTRCPFKLDQSPFQGRPVPAPEVLLQEVDLQAASPHGGIEIFVVTGLSVLKLSWNFYSRPWWQLQVLRQIWYLQLQPTPRTSIKEQISK